MANHLAQLNCTFPESVVLTEPIILTLQFLYTTDEVSLSIFYSSMTLVNLFFPLFSCFLTEFSISHFTLLQTMYCFNFLCFRFTPRWLPTGDPCISSKSLIFITELPIFMFELSTSHYILQLLYFLFSTSRVYSITFFGSSPLSYTTFPFSLSCK